MENLIEFNPETSIIAAQKTPLLDWCLNCISKTSEMEFNQLYAAEILCILMSNEENRAWFTKSERLETLLQRIAVCHHIWSINTNRSKVLSQK